MHRRDVLGIAGTAALASTAGCLGVITGSEAVERTANEATVPQSVLEGTDYELAETYEKTITREFDTPVGKREAKAHNQIAEYNRSVQVGTESIRAAVFAVLATPAFDFGDKTFNPVGNMTNKELAKMVQGQYSGLSVGDRVDEVTVSMLGSDVPLTKFEGRGTVEGQQVPVYVHVGKVEHGSDFVVPIAVYPQQFEDEAETAVTFAEGLEHSK